MIWGSVFCSQLCSQPKGILETKMDALRIRGRLELVAEFNCRLICQQRVVGSNPTRRLNSLLFGGRS
jgi:hypothetical protein